MDLLTEKQISELIVEYENRNKAMVEKIKEELRNRKELKKKFEEAKQREALQLQILERLEESEKMVRKQLDLVAKMEDNESLKQLKLIKTYEQMLDEQKKTWYNYKAQYEGLLSVKTVRKAEAELLRAKIQYGLLVQKMRDTQRMVQLREMVRKQQERAQIIKFAKMYVEHMKKQKRCEQLLDQNRKLTAQAQQMRSELQEREKDKKPNLDVELKNASPLMKPQQLPQVDLSRFIIHRDKGNDKLDTMSINSYILEEEYMNNNGQSNPKSNNTENKNMEVDSQDTMHMDIDTQETDSQESELVESNEPPKRLNFKGSFDNEAKTQCTPLVAERNNNEMQNHVQSNSSNQSRSQVAEHNRTPDQTMDSQEIHDSSGSKQSSRKRVNQKQPQNKENTPMHVSFVNVDDRNAQNNCSSPYDRPVPTPAKMTKSSFQEKFPHQQTSKQEHHQQHQYQQEIPQQNQQQQPSKRSLQEIQQEQNQFQQQQKRSSQEMMQQQQQQNQFQQQQKRSSQEMYQQQQQQNQFQQQQKRSSQDMIQQHQQSSRKSSQEMYQQQQQQQPRHTPQEMYQQNQRQQDMYLRSEQRQVSPQNTEQIDFSRLPSNKPKIVSNEYVNYDLQDLQRKQKVVIQPKTETMTPRTSMETPNTSAMAKTASTPLAQQGPFAFGLNSSVNVTPVSANIEPSSMMSTTMHSMDNFLPDNISVILGSEITEPGGSIELARRFYDSDFNSECGDFDIDKIMSNMSPLHKISPKAQHSQAPANNSAQPPTNNQITQNAQDINSNPNGRAFNFAGFGRTHASTNQRFF